MKLKKCSLLIACLMVLLVANGITSCKPHVEENTTVVTNDDGSVTTTVTNDDGSTTATTEYTDGSKKVEIKNTDGSSQITENQADGTEKVTVNNVDGNSEITTKTTDGTTIVENDYTDGSSTIVTTYSSGDKTEVSKTAAGSVTTVETTTDSAGTVSVKTTDNDGNITEVKTATDGSVTTIETTTDSSGKKTEKTTDSAGTVVVKTTDNSGNITEVRTAADGSVTTIKTAADGSVTVTEKTTDSAGTVTEKTTDSSGNSTTTITTADGEKTKIVVKKDSTGAVVTTTTEPSGKITEVTVAADGTTTTVITEKNADDTTTETELSSSSTHMVLSCCEEGIKATLRDIPAIYSLITHELHVDGEEVFAYVNYSGLLYEEDDIEVIYPFVTNGETYTLNLLIDYIDSTGKECSIDEKASIKAEGTAQTKCPLNVQNVKKCDVKVTYSTDEKDFCYKINTNVTDADSIINMENVKYMYICNSVYSDTTTVTSCSLYNPENILAKNKQSTVFNSSAASLSKALNKYNNFSYDVVWDFSLSSSEYRWYGYKTSKKSVSVSAAYNGKSFVGNWKEVTDSDSFDSIAIDKYGYVTMYSSSNGRNYCGKINYTSDSDINIKYTQYSYNGSSYYGTTSDPVYLTYSDGKLKFNKSGKVFEKTTLSTSELNLTVTLNLDALNITTSYDESDLVVNLGNTNYYITKIEIDGVPFNYSSSTRTTIHTGNLSKGNHILTVYYYPSGNYNLTQSECITFEVK